MFRNKWLKDDSGFSLIEVVLAVAILALVALPIINYFTYSSLQAIEGRDRQCATTAAENVVEELSSYSNYTQIRDLTATPDPAGPASSAAPVWQKSSPKPGESPDPQSDYLERPVTVDGFDYVAKVQVQYGVYKSGTKAIVAGEKVGSGTGDLRSPKYNSYNIPSPSEVYAPSNAVAVEDDELDTALSELFTTLSASAPGTSGAIADRDAIRAGLTRVIHIDIDYKDIEKKEYAVHVYYRYEYSGHTVDVTLEKAEIPINQFKGVFLFYNPLVTDKEEKVIMNIASNIPCSEDQRVSDETIVNDMEFYFAVQGTVDKTEYKLDIAAGTATGAKFFANDIMLTSVTGNLQEGSDPGDKMHSFVGRKQKERIGRILVDIYDTAGKKAGEVVAHMETTMAE